MCVVFLTHNKSFDPKVEQNKPIENSYIVGNKHDSKDDEMIEWWIEPEPIKITTSAIYVSRQFNVLQSMRKTAQKAIISFSTAYKRKKNKI